MKIDVIMAMTTLFLMRKSDAAWRAAGATIDEEAREMKLKDETTKVAAHLRRNDQLQKDKGSANLLLGISYELTFSGYQDLGDRPNLCREIVLDHMEEEVWARRLLRWLLG